MIIKSLKLKNFRQFMGEHEIIFSTDTDKNVTIVIADNGTGKTTLEQSFSWIFFGETSFKKKDIFNSKLVLDLPAQKIIHASGELVVSHLNTEYKITRVESARKLANRLASIESELKVEYKVSGMTKELKNEDAKKIIATIIPKNLFQYFFFDGEKIEKIGTEIDRGKSKEFADAIRGMLGFNALYSGKNHLKKLIAQYQSEYDKSQDQILIEATKTISDSNATIDSNDIRLGEIENEIKNYEHLRLKVSEEIANSPNVKEKQERAIELVGIIEVGTASVNRTKKELFSFVSSNSTMFIAYPLMIKAKSIIDNSEASNKGIPGIESKAIQYILEKKRCICGCDLLKNPEAIATLENLEKYLPPQNIGYEIVNFKHSIDENINKAHGFWLEFQSKREDLKEKEDGLERSKKESNDIATAIKSFPNMKEKKNREETYYNNILKLTEESGNLKNENEKAAKAISLAEGNRHKYTIQNEKNKKIALYENYANEIVKKMTEYAETREKQKLADLNKVINGIFSVIFNSNMKIEIDNEYNIKVINVEVGESLEKSSAQNVSITFSFIAGIIKMAREKVTGYDDNSDLEEQLSPEPYPLVMDAPLSSFDKTRIKNVCQILPGIAEQVVIFIKDTDGDIAKEHLTEKIGCEYRLHALTNTSTEIAEVK
ncbi:MAG: AAA family ATPase [Firmicutes bacterium]|nr:AAA family ATPase [Bacillota bacterium]